MFSHNAPAVGLYRSLGFVEEGLLRRALFIDGRYIDVALMALNRGDRAVEKNLHEAVDLSEARSSFA